MTTDKMLKERVWTAILSLTLTGAVYAAPVHAQTNSTTNSTDNQTQNAAQYIVLNFDIDLGTDDIDPNNVATINHTYRDLSDPLLPGFTGVIDQFYYTGNLDSLPGSDAADGSSKVRYFRRDSMRVSDFDYDSTPVYNLQVAAYDDNTPSTPDGSPGAMTRTPQMQGMASSGMAAGSEYLYILRGNTVYQMRTSDFALVGQRDLPMPDRTAMYRNDTMRSTAPANRSMNNAVQPDSGSTAFGDTGDTNAVIGSGSGSSNGTNPRNNTGTELPTTPQVPSDSAPPSPNMPGTPSDPNAMPSNDGAAQAGGTTSNSGQMLKKLRANEQRTSRFHSTRTGRTMTSGTVAYRQMMPASLSLAGDYLYILRGGTVYQMRASDLKLVSQKMLPTTMGSTGSSSR